MASTDKELNFRLPSPRASFLAVWGALSLLALFLVKTAARLKIDYFDSYTLFQNALAVLNRDGSLYSFRQPLLVPTLGAPLFWLERRLGIEDFAFTAWHLAAAGVFALTLAALYRLYRLHLTPRPALLGVLLFAFNPLVIHQAPFGKEDLAGTLATILCFYFYLQARERGRTRDFILSGLSLAFAVETRRHLGAAFFAAIALNEWPERGSSPARPLVKLLWLFLLPATALAAVPLVYYPWLRHSDWMGALPLFLKEQAGYLGTLAEYARSRGETPLEVFGFLARSCTLPVLLLAAAGAAQALRKQSPGAAPHAVWLFVFLASAALLIPHKEARYLFPLLPPLYFFAASGARETLALWRQSPRARKFPSWLAAAALTVLVLLPARLAGRELLKFDDPFYSDHVEKRASRYARELAGPGALYWVGPFYPFYPREFLFDPADDFTYVYHFFTHQVVFYAGGPRPAKLPGGGRAQPPEEAAWFAGPAAETAAKDGDVLIVNPDPEYRDSSNLRPGHPPLIVERIRKIRWSPGMKVPEGTYTVYREKNGKLDFQGYADALKKPFEPPAGADSLTLVTYDSVKRFGG